MKKIEVENKEKFIRSLGKRMDETSLLCRLGMMGKKDFAGIVTERRVLLYRKKMGALSLFALTLRGKWVKEEGKDVLLCRFSRSLPLSLLWGAWCLLMLAAGLSIVRTDPVFCLVFLLPGALLSLPLFLFSQKEKEHLLDHLRTIACDLRKGYEERSEKR